MADTTSKRLRLRRAGTLNPHPERVVAPRFQTSPFYDPDDLLQVRYEVIRAVRQEGTGRTAAARAHGLSRHTVHRLERLFEAEGLAGLVPRKRGPRGPHKITDEILRFVDRRRAEQGPAGSTVLVREIEARFGITIHRVSLDHSLARRAKKTPSADRR